MREGWGGDDSPRASERNTKAADMGLSSRDPHFWKTTRTFEREVEMDSEFARRCAGKGNFFFVNGAGGYDPEMRWDPANAPNYFDEGEF